jgi:hypothetical protein
MPQNQPGLAGDPAAIEWLRNTWLGRALAPTTERQGQVATAIDAIKAANPQADTGDLATRAVGNIPLPAPQQPQVRTYPTAEEIVRQMQNQRPTYGPDGKVVPGVYQR